MAANVDAPSDKMSTWRPAGAYAQVAGLTRTIRREARTLGEVTSKRDSATEKSPAPDDNCQNQLMAPVRAIAHALLGSIFVAAGARALLEPKRYADRAAPVAERVGSALTSVDERLPNSTEALIRVSGAIQVGGGLLLATGTAVRPAAAALAGTLIPATLAEHPFWSARTRGTKQADAVHFAKNMGLLGGLLLAMVDTQGRPGLRWRTRRLYDDTSKSLRRAARTASREAKLVARATEAGRHLPS